MSICFFDGRVERRTKANSRYRRKKEEEQKKKQELKKLLDEIDMQELVDKVKEEKGWNKQIE